ncbi:MAG: chemotaxis response regulator protein-glutamate methylesterase [Muribaculaceae bacterium]|nr:chemotaxis response regulator protein-glutamate methylesterase [Roseburia sp.]MCM1430351.1 chemotaxis response regulator protein-glutamate methylesterase [Muribaculaceae bacterium]MCM1492453.1 chemotaxis response regulator protein-glutamate methylesterase [Muribaculaceae bacterium]
MNQIKVLVVDDSMVFRKLLVKSLTRDPSITVVATATDPYQARDAIIKYKPDVMTLDVELPRMNGIEFLRKLMPQYPIPTVVISSLSDAVFDALSAGAVDFAAKPQPTDKVEMDAFLNTELPQKVKIAAMAQINKGKRAIANAPVTVDAFKGSLIDQRLIVAIGASTGGTEAIAAVIKEFEPNIPGVVVVQHMPPGFTQMYANRLNNQCRVSVKEAETGDVVRQGHVLIAPGGNRQMRLVKKGDQYQVECREGPKVNGHCPSVDVLFDSVASVAGKYALGIILTGMGGDGAKGLLKMRQAGSPTIGQDESTCVVYGMPKVAYELGAVQFQEKLTDIPKRAYNILNKMQRMEDAK